MQQIAMDLQGRTMPAIIAAGSFASPIDIDIDPPSPASTRDSTSLTAILSWPADEQPLLGPATQSTSPGQIHGLHTSEAFILKQEICSMMPTIAGLVPLHEICSLSHQAFHMPVLCFNEALISQCSADAGTEVELNEQPAADAQSDAGNFSSSTPNSISATASANLPEQAETIAAFYGDRSPQSLSAAAVSASAANKSSPTKHVILDGTKVQRLSMRHTKVNDLCGGTAALPACATCA